MKSRFAQLLGINDDFMKKTGLFVTNKTIELNKIVSRFFDIRYKPNHQRIEIDITHACNLHCYNCNRSCTQAPTNEYMTVEQVKKFVHESVEKARKWEKIRIMGGEPTLHPHLFDILSTLVAFKKNYSPKTRLILVSNGYGPKVRRVLERIPEAIEVENTAKITIAQKFDTFNVAPADLDQYKGKDFSRGCFLTVFCGIGLNRYGYYPCAVGGGIDRVYGFNIGKKTLPPDNDTMREQLQTLCRYCGHFKWSTAKIKQEEISASWKEIYEKVKKEKPTLSIY